MDYIPHSEGQVREMLGRLGLASADALFSDIPPSLRLKRSPALPAGMNEHDARRKFRDLMDLNTVRASRQVCLMGAGAYSHFIPSAIDAIVSRGEFLTAYTPYQPEISQGLLQSIWEFQEMVCRLTGLEVSNASHYDAATALSEALIMAANITGKDRVLLPDTLNPQYRAVCETYNMSGRFRLAALKHSGGRIDPAALKDAIDDTTAAVVVQSPNWFGQIEDLEEAGRLCREKGCLLIAVSNPVSLGLLKSPGECGADIAVAEGQPLGIPLSFGGPYLGILAAKKKYIRNLPGRIVGRTVDAEGRTAFVLTLQAREQHIRREKASSNICSNQALSALRAGIYLSLMGGEGLKNVALACRRGAARLFVSLTGTGLLKPAFNGPFFNEFCVRFPSAAVRDRVRTALMKEDIQLGVPLDDPPDGLLVCVTETVSEADLDRVGLRVKELLHG
jgi:glycine dehydrogenase subunit 1